MTTAIWNREAPRAVAPSKILEAALYPVECAAEHARDTALAYGAGLRIGNDDCITSEVPLIWVSANVAESRKSSGVLPGWYIKAEPGDYFKLLITNVHVDDPDFYSCAALIEVDGVNPLGQSKLQICRPGKEVALQGFATGWHYKGRNVNGKVNVRRFRFKNANEDDEATSDEKGVGSVVIRVPNGWTKNVRLGTEETKNLLDRPMQCVNEHEANKMGMSVRVDRSGEEIEERVQRAKHHFKYNHCEDSFVIYIRERWWLETRKIIDRNGAAWKPTIVKEPIDLTLIEESKIISRRNSARRRF